MISRVKSEQQALVAARADFARRRETAGERLFIGLYQDGGIGDTMREAAFARAVRRRWPGAYICIICRDLGPDADGQPLVVNLLRGHDSMDAAVLLPHVPWQQAVRAFYDQFDLFYEVGYCVRTYAWRDPDLQHAADLRLRPFARYMWDFPRTSRGIEQTGMTQWQLMAATSGLDVREADLTITPGPMPPQLARQKYVVLHNMAGGMALAKTAPLATFAGVAAELKRRSVRSVQVGAPNDPPIRGAQDCRGVPIRVSAAVLKHARLLIDVEGGVGYVARAVGTRRAVLFGPTPISLFRFRDDVILCRQRCPPCWHRCDRWAVSCPDQHPTCRNIPTNPAQIVQAVEPYLKGL